MELEKFIPKNTVRGQIKVWHPEPECSHEQMTICEQVTSAGALMYWKTCSVCGKGANSCGVGVRKGELSHATVARNYRVEEIESKAMATARWEAFYLENIELRERVYQDYRAYLDSPEWYDLRQSVIRRDGHCQSCGGAIEDVHHLTYERLFNEHLEDLVGLCRPCHAAVHGIVEAAA